VPAGGGSSRGVEPISGGRIHVPGNIKSPCVQNQDVQSEKEDIELARDFEQDEVSEG
jgi:hypothetical protein